MSLTFLSPMVLLGLAALAVPIIIHLILRRKPRHMMFPAFRFLQQRRKTNLRKLQLRHLLLLALRLLLFAVFAAALARPLLRGGPAELAGNSDLGLVFIIDSSSSMNYVHDGKSRLDLAREIAGALIDQAPLGSQVAVLDTGEVGGQFLPPRDARKLIANRRILPRSRSVTALVDDAYRLLESSAPDLPLLICIISDRTAASWDAEAARLLPKLPDLETKLKRSVKVVYLDLGVAEPRDICITGLALRTSGGSAVAMEDVRLGVSARTPASIQANLEVTGASVNTEVQLFIDGKLYDQQRLQVNVAPGQQVKQPVTFKPYVFTSSHHGGEVRLRSADALEDNNVRYWTLQVSRRKVLIIADEPADALDWKIALETLEEKLPVEVKVLRTGECPAQIAPEQYQAVCLFNVAKPGVALWQTLDRFVTAGGGLILLPGEDCDPAAWNSAEALAVTPAKVLRQKAVPSPGAFMVPDYDHPMMERFKLWEQPLTPARVHRFWEVEPIGNLQSRIIAAYSDGDRPALVERVFDRKQVLGRVVLFTTLMYRRTSRGWKDWNNFLEESGGAGWIAALALPYLSVEHVLAARGESTNFVLGEDIRFLLPTAQRFPDYRLTGPQSGTGKVAQQATTLALPEIARPGSYEISDLQGNLWSMSFSVNLPTRETQLLLNRPAPEQIQETLGEGSVLAWSDELDLRKMMRDRLGQAQETDLLPLFMLLCLVLLAAENLLANRFYRGETDENP
jgi:hypothetical protein